MPAPPTRTASSATVPGSRPVGSSDSTTGWTQGSRAPAAPDLSAVGRRLSSFGVTGVTDATPTESPDYFETLAAAVRSGALPLQVVVTGGPALSAHRAPPPLVLGPVKIVIADHELPELADVVEAIEAAHGAGRPVAIHCVTRSALVLALAAFEDARVRSGDRIEHASLTPSELIARLVQFGLTVVTQPAFLLARGDAYLREVTVADRPDLYRCASLIDARVSVAASTDAPFGPDDPWLAVRSATERRSQSGAAVGDDAPLAPWRALDLFLGPLDAPGGPPRRVGVGAPADLCLLERPIADVLRAPSSDLVAATIVAGAVTYTR